MEGGSDSYIIYNTRMSIEIRDETNNRNFYIMHVFVNFI